MNPRHALAACAAATLLTACGRTYVEGRATNMRGEALPGVTVSVAGTTAQDLTDGLGRYRIATPPGAATLVFSKSGYTSDEVTLEATHRGAPGEAVLWVLPMNPGVYVMGGTSYDEISWVVPKQYALKDGTAAFGVELPGDVLEASSEPFLLTHRTPRYNAQLSRLEAEDARLEGIEDKSIEVWVERGRMSVGLDPVDRDGSMLQRVQMDRTLDPGVYGIHWGAMEGYTTLDNRVFVFRVPEPLTSDEDAAPDEAAETEAPAEDTGEDDAPKKDEDAPAAEETPAAAPKPAPATQDVLEPADENPVHR